MTLLTNRYPITTFLRCHNWGLKNTGSQCCEVQNLSKFDWSSSGHHLETDINSKLVCSQFTNTMCIAVSSRQCVSCFHLTYDIRWQDPSPLMLWKPFVIVLAHYGWDSINFSSRPCEKYRVINKYVNSILFTWDHSNLDYSF